MEGNKHIYKVGQGERIDEICKKCNDVSKELLIKWNRDLYEKYKSKRNFDESYPFPYGVELCYYDSDPFVSDSHDAPVQSEVALPSASEPESVKDYPQAPMVFTVLDDGDLSDGGNSSELEVNKSPYAYELQRLRDENARLKQEIERLVEENEQLRNKNTPSTPTEEQPKKEGVLYAMFIIDGLLQRVKYTPSDETIFELRMKDESMADLDIYKPAYQKILADSSFLDGCDKNVLGSTTLEIRQLGEAVKENDMWKVTKKLNVVIK